MKQTPFFIALTLWLHLAVSGWACGWMDRSSDQIGPTWWPSAAEIDTTEIWMLPTSVGSMCDHNSECQPSLTADGKELFYSIGRVNGPTPDGLFYGTEDHSWNVYTARWNEAESRWDSIANVGPTVNPARDPCITPSGDTLYVSKNADIYVAYRNPVTFEFDSLELIGPPVSESTSAEAFPHITRDGKRLYFNSNREPEQPWGGGFDIYVAYRNPITAEWDSVAMLGPGVNTADTEGSPSLSPDETRLRFTDFPGYRHGPKYGEFDLYVSVWDSMLGDWGPAKLAAPPLNFDKSICSSFETLDGKLYLGSEIWDGVKGEEDLMVTERVSSAPHYVQTPESPGAWSRSEWVEVGELPGARFVYDLVQTPNGHLFAGTLADPIEAPRAVVYRSTDMGDTWIPTSPLVDAMAVLSLIAVGDTLYAGTYPNGDVFRSINGGAVWAATGDLGGATGVRALMHTSDGVILAGTSPDSSKVYRLFKSANAGETWTRLGDAPNATGGLEDLFETPDGVLFAGGRHYQHNENVIIYVSIDGGATWTMRQLPITDDDLTIGQIIFFTETSDGTIWTGGWAHGPQGILCRSTDGGIDWEWLPSLYRGSPDSPVTVPRFFDMVEAADGSYILAAQPAPDSVCWRSTDNGDTWRLMGPLTGAWEALCLMRASDGTIFAGTTPHGDVFKWVPSGGSDAPNVTRPVSLKVYEENATTYIVEFTLPGASDVELKAYNAMGRVVASLAEGSYRAGRYVIRWKLDDSQGNQLPSGAYLLQLRTDHGSASGTAVIVR